SVGGAFCARLGGRGGGGGGGGGAGAARGRGGGGGGGGGVGVLRLAGRAGPPPPTLPLWWVRGHAEALPLADQTVDRVLMSLVLHQIVHRPQALQEVYRVLRPGGRVLVRTVAPAVTLQDWVPFRFFPKVAHVQAARLPAIDVILTLCQQAGFRALHTRTVCRNARVDLHKVTEELRQRKRPSYRLLTDAEPEDGLPRIQQGGDARG